MNIFNSIALHQMIGNPMCNRTLHKFNFSVT